MTNFCNDHPSSRTIIFVFTLSVLSHYVYFKTRQCFVLIIISYSVFDNQRLSTEILSHYWTSYNLIAVGQSRDYVYFAM